MAKEPKPKYLFYIDPVRNFSITKQWEGPTYYKIGKTYPIGMYKHAYSIAQAREYMKIDIAKRFNVEPWQVNIALADIDWINKD